MNTTKNQQVVRNLPQSLDCSQAQRSAELMANHREQRGLFGDLAVGQKHSLEAALKNIFPEPKEETRLQQTRQAMGDAVAELTDQELEGYLAEFQYLVDCWLDEFERSVFNNVTLKQLLGEV